MERVNEPLNRIITLGDINDENSSNVIQLIHEINYIDAQNGYIFEPITLIVNSYGGDIYRGLGIVDTILNSKTPVHTVCYGAALSMGFIIMAVGHERASSKYSTFMYHEGSYDLGEIKLTNHKYELEELKRIEKVYDDIIINHTNISQRKLNSMKKNKDWYLDAEEALKYGVIDKIL